MSTATSTRSASFWTLIGLALVTLCGVSGLSLRNAILDTPIYASDEYAYLATGKFYQERALLWSNDPGLQQIPNILYFRIVKACFSISSHAWDTLRVMNVILYSAVGLLVAAIIYHRSTGGVTCGFLILYFLLPWSGYVASVMPEVAAYFTIALVAIAAVAAIRRRSLLLCAAAGLLAAGSYYVKPNVVAVVMGTALFFLAHFREDKSRQQRLLCGCSAIAIFLASLYFGVLLWRWLAGEPFAWGPDLISGFYASELAQPSGGVWHTFARLCAYSTGHALALLLLFPLGIAGIAQLLWKNENAAKPCTGVSSTTITLSRWFSWVLGPSILAVSYYSVKTEIGRCDPRLYGRYLAFAFPLLLLFSLLFFHTNSARANRSAATKRLWFRIAGILLFSGLLGWHLLACRHFRIYPWDYPELTAFFSNQNTYWHDRALWNTRLPVTLAALVTGAALLSGRAFARYIGIAYLALCLVLANANNTAFQVTTRNSLGRLALMAQNLTALAQLDRHRGVVIGADRYGGPLPYVLFGIASNVTVLTRAHGSEVLPQDLPPDCEWVLFDGNFVPQFHYWAMLKTGTLSLFLIKQQAGLSIILDTAKQSNAKQQGKL